MSFRSDEVDEARERGSSGQRERAVRRESESEWRIPRAARGGWRRRPPGSEGRQARVCRCDHVIVASASFFFAALSRCLLVKGTRLLFFALVTIRSARRDWQRQVLRQPRASRAALDLPSTASHLAQLGPLSCVCVLVGPKRSISTFRNDLLPLAYPPISF